MSSIERVCNLKLGLMAAVLAVGLAVADVNAYATDRATLQKEFEMTFDQMLEDPTDIALTKKYAKLAVELGDYEAAIPPLERLLMFNPDLVEVRLEVGVLYFLLNSHAISKEYLMEVKNHKDVTPELDRRADQYLARM